MGLDGFALDLIEMTAHFFRGVSLVIEMRDKIGDRLFKMNHVFPQCVIGIDEQGLRLKKANRLVRSTHQFIIDRPCVYFMSRQLGPTPQSTRTGTLS